MNKEQQQTYIWIAYSLFQWLKAFAFASTLIGIVLTNFNVVAFALFFYGLSFMWHWFEYDNIQNAKLKIKEFNQSFLTKPPKDPDVLA